MKKLLLFIFLLGSLTAFSQGTVSGTLIDSETGDTLPSANVVETGTLNGTVSDMDGKFSLNVSNNDGTITISFVGYSTRVVSYTLTNGSVDLGSVNVDIDADALGEVVVVGKGVIDLAGGRKTPVAVTTIMAEEIQRKVSGNVEVTEALKNAPSTHISGETGFGDSQFYLRGFDQTNIAILLNGQPVNGMEDGRVYWSNWAGISDIANAIQVQRGLGASKLAISSVGGTTNIVMKAADLKAGGFARFIGGNDSYAKGTFSYNTGRNANGWAFSALVDYWQAHRKWAKGTYGQGQNYFFAVGYKPNDTHSFNFLITGAPQLHGQKWSQSRERIDADPKFNEHWGRDSETGVNGTSITSERQNYYHKPVMNFNWDWNISDKTDLSTVAYASWGRGGGTGNYGRSNNRIRTEDPDGDGPLIGQIDYEAIRANNATVDGLVGYYGSDGGYARRASVNNHQWFGLVSNLSHDLTENLSLNVGVDGRHYTGDHFRQLVDLYGLDGWDDGTDYGVITATYDATPWASLMDFASEEERIGYDYSETIQYIGGFGQLEYAKDNFTMFVQGAYSNQSYEREGRFVAHESGLGTSDKVSKTGYNIKGGTSYTIADNHRVYLNAGFYSRQPYLDNIFKNVRSSNEFYDNPEVDNEEITSFEAGYQYKNNRVKANFNAYATDWDNRTLTSFGYDDGPDGLPDTADDIEINILQRGVRQYHAGAEFDVTYKPTDWLSLMGYVSGGSWYYKGESSFFIYNDTTGDLMSEEDGVNRDGVKVSTAPQVTMGLGGLVKIVKGLSVDANINYRDRHYTFTDESTEMGPDYKAERLGAYAITDAGLTYKFDLGSNKLTFRANVYNVFDAIKASNSDRFGFFTTNGRTFNASLKYAF